MTRSLRRLFLVVSALAIAVVSAGAYFYLTNTAPPVPRLSAAALATSTQPFVVKLHAQWCPVCMVTKGSWAEIEQAYAGRVHFVVLDFTGDAETAASITEAKRLGFGEDFDEHIGSTGGVVVVDGRTRRVVGSVYGDVATAEYRALIDEALRTSLAPGAP